jgi:two-component system phosphate regulon response regulator PhoB
MPATILVVEDEPAIQELISAALQCAGHRVAPAFSAEEAATLISKTLPDMALIDWMLPGMDGIQYTRRLRGDERTRDLPIIVLTARGEESDKIAGLDAGADDYLTKPFSPRELMARIRAVLRRRAPQMTEDCVEREGLCLDPVTHRVSGNGHWLELGPTEFRLLHFFMTHPERVFDRAMLLDRVWGDHVFIEERTVDVHIRRLRAVLEATGHHRLIQTVRGSGYRFSTQAD